MTSGSFTCAPETFLGFSMCTAMRKVQLSARSWRPASESEGNQAKPYSYVDPAGVGLTSIIWSNFPKLAAPSLSPLLREMERAGVLINFPSFLSRPALVKKRVNRGGPPPPPPHMPESSRGSGAGLANWSRNARASDEDLIETGVPSALQEFAGADCVGAFQRIQRADTVSFLRKLRDSAQG